MAEFIDMDIYSRRIGPYFTWLESKIESGWRQSDSCRKNVLKETKELAQGMRARFILGITHADFSEEIDRAMQLFDLALDAFPDYSVEVEQKLQHFMKGLKTEFGDSIVPNCAAAEPEIESSPIVERADPIVTQKKLSVKNPKAEKPIVEKRAEKKKVMKKKKAVKKLVKKVERKADLAEPAVKPAEQKIVEQKPAEQKVEKKAPKKPGRISRWLRNLIFGDDL